MKGETLFRVLHKQSSGSTSVTKAQMCLPYTSSAVFKGELSIAGTISKTLMKKTMRRSLKRRTLRKRMRTKKRMTTKPWDTAVSILQRKLG